MRIRLKEQANYPFSTTMQIRITDLNYGNHMGNQMLLSYAQEARSQWLGWLGGWSEVSVANQGIIMGDAAVVYQSEGKGGEILLIEVAVGDISRVSFDLYYRITEQSTGRAVGLVKTGIVFFDYQTSKVAAVPEAFLKAIEAKK